MDSEQKSVSMWDALLKTETLTLDCLNDNQEFRHLVETYQNLSKDSDENSDAINRNFESHITQIEYKHVDAHLFNLIGRNLDEWKNMDNEKMRMIFETSFEDLMKILNLTPTEHFDYNGLLLEDIVFCVMEDMIVMLSENSYINHDKYKSEYLTHLNRSTEQFLEHQKQWPVFRKIIGCLLQHQTMIEEIQETVQEIDKKFEVLLGM